MAESFSFDVVSDFDRQELVNTLDQVKREISQRYDLKGTDTSVDLEKENIFIITNSELTLNAVNDIICLLYTSPSPRDRSSSRMPSSA